MRALFSAASGMSAQQTQLETIANNIANVGTTSFKASRASFEDLFYQQLTYGGRRAGAPGLALGSGTRLASLQKDHATGSLTSTGNPLHMAIQGSGYFVLETPEGEPLYTRDGRFTLDADGSLVTSSGLRASGGIVVPPDAQSIQIQPDGTLTAVLGGDSQPTTLGQVEVVDFTNRGGLRAVGGNLYQVTPESGQPQPIQVGPTQQVVQGFLEDSNVDVAEELVQMILTQRAYEMNSKVVQAADETLGVAVNLRR